MAVADLLDLAYGIVEKWTSSQRLPPSLLKLPCYLLSNVSALRPPHCDKMEAAVNASFPTPVLYGDVLWGEWHLDKTVHFMDYTHLPIALAVTMFYVGMVYYGQRYMEDKPAWDLRHTLTAWNFGLSAFSGYSFFKLFPETFNSLMKGGMIGTLCYNGDLYKDEVYGYWIWLFAMSKGPELIDTVFLILRKREIIFLHWYHHSLTYIGGSIFFSALVPWTRWIAILNLGVHTVMYFYFGTRSAGLHLPSTLSKMITTAQIIQFACGFYFFFRLCWMYVSNEAADLPECHPKLDLLGLGMIVLGSYIYLFSKFFYNAYIKKDSKKRAREAKIKEVTAEKEATKKDQ